MNQFGHQAAHQIIMPTCRKNRGQAGAWEEAVQRLREQYDMICRNRTDIEECDLHLVLYCDTPRHKQARGGYCPSEPPGEARP
jgi:hypothetical protein